jgi:hypothetical protein
MKQETAAQLADWIANNTRGYARRDGNIIYIEGKIDAYELLLYAQSLLTGRTTEQIHEDNRISYTGRADLYRRDDMPINAAVEGADW